MKNQLSKREYKYRCKIIAEKQIKKYEEKIWQLKNEIAGLR